MPLDNSFSDFDPENFNDFDPDDFDGFDAPDNLHGRARARHELKKAQHELNKQNNRKRKDAARERRLIIKQAKSPTPMVDTLNNSPSLEDQASQNNVTPDQQADSVITPYHDQLKTMLNNGGVVTSPTGNIAEDATRFVMMRQNNAIDRQHAQLASLAEEGMSEDEQLQHVQSPDEIEEDQLREDSENFGDGFDSFFPSVFGAVKALGSKGIAAIKADREKKNAVIAGNAGDKAALQAKLDMQTAANDVLKKKKDKEDETTKYIVIGVIVILAIGCLIAFMSKKKSA